MYLADAIERVKRAHRLLIERRVTLSTAESCTGGMIADMITEVGGASRFFIGSVIAYHEDVKIKLLGVKEKTIKNHGVVSKETALEMAEGVRELLKTDVGISTTGNLGPEALEGKDVGLVYIGLSFCDENFVEEIHLTGLRQENKIMAATKAIEFLIKKLEALGN